MLTASSRPWHLLQVTWKVVGLLMLLCQPAHADVGVPMIFVVWPASWVLLLLIIPIETWIARRTLTFDVRKALKMVSRANLVSTLVGLPFTWLLLVLLQTLLGGDSAWGLDTTKQRIAAVTVQSPWLIPYDHALDWMVPTAAAVLCIPFFFISVACEFWVSQRFVDKEQHQQLKRWAWQANLLSYGLIELILGLKLLLVFHYGGTF